MMTLLRTALVMILAMSPAALGQRGRPPQAPPGGGERGEEAAAETDEQEPSVTQHQVTVDGRTLDYTATAGMLPLMEEDGTVKANVFFIAYTLDGDHEPGERPITFTFNGGPGSSSVWLHLGAFGPRRVVMNEEGHPVGPPYKMEANPGTILDVSDLVFIDPVTTGFSRAVPDEPPRQFHGVEEDVQAVGEFIRLYTTRYERWSSPKFLAGESYGTTRAAALAGHLQDRLGMFLNGVILISSILDFQTARFDPGNDLASVLLLPTLTATAWYHQQLDGELQADLDATLGRVEEFAIREYAPALLLGSDLPQARRDEIAAELARLTGVDRDYVERANLRLTTGRFTKELLRDQRRTVGRLDSRFIGIDRDAAGEGYEYDPSYAAIQGPYTAMLNHYVREDLGFESDVPYEILTGRVQPWNYGRARNRYLNVAETLRSAISQNPSLHVFVASGYYDMATPYFATDYTFSHLGLEPELQDNIEVHYYESGHMMYIHHPSLLKLRRDLVSFYREALPGDE